MAAGNVTTLTINGNAFGTNVPTVNFSDGSIRYTLSRYSDTQIIANVSVSANRPDGVVNVSVTSNGYNGQGFQGSGNGQSANSSPSVAGTYHVWNHTEVTVIGWVNPNAITLPGGANSQLQFELNSGSGCAYDVAQWALSRRYHLNSSIDVDYANAFLLINSSNSQPPSTINPSLYLAGGDSGFSTTTALQMVVHTRLEARRIHVEETILLIG